MNVDRGIHATARLLGAVAGLAAASYATYVTVTWLRYGRPKSPGADDADVLLEQFMPRYDVVDRHKLPIAAPVDITYSAALELDLQSSPLIRAIFKGREWILRSKPDLGTRPAGLLAEMKSLGWGVLAEKPGREIVMGGITKPWEANPVFQSLPPDDFAAFNAPGYVKIIWTLRADPTERGTLFRTETRAIATDAFARRKFRRYWAFLSPGILLIRTAMLRTLKTEAERREWRGNQGTSFYHRL